jgi:hypothetical protein
MNNADYDVVTKFVGTADKHQLESLNDLIRARWDAIDRQEAAKFYVGQKVRFYGNRGHGLVEGVITKINPKTIKVKQEREGAGPMMWRVSPGLLKAA